VGLCAGHARLTWRPVARGARTVKPTPRSIVAAAPGSSFGLRRIASTCYERGSFSCFRSAEGNFLRAALAVGPSLIMRSAVANRTGSSLRSNP